MTFPSRYPLPRGVSEITSTLFRLPFSARSERRKCARARGVITFHYFVPAKQITFMRKSVPYSLPSYTDVAINKKVIVTFRIWELNKSVFISDTFHENKITVEQSKFSIWSHRPSSVYSGGASYPRKKKLKPFSGSPEKARCTNVFPKAFRLVLFESIYCH